MFDNITGYRTGQRVLSASIANAGRLGMTLRLGTDLDDRALVDALRSRPNHWAATLANYPTREVNSDPMCENVVKPPELDLLDFPITSRDLESTVGDQLPSQIVRSRRVG
jgi:hypothetical protein